MRPLSKVNFVSSDISKLNEGMRVEHQKFGFGQVVKLEGSAHNPVATIKFDQNGGEEDHAELCQADDCNVNINKRTNDLQEKATDPLWLFHLSAPNGLPFMEPARLDNKMVQQEMVVSVSFSASVYRFNYRLLPVKKIKPFGPCL